MKDIVDTIEIEADPAFVLDALTTQPTRWWLTDARVALESKSLGGIALRGTGGVWEGSRLHIAFARMARGTRVAVLHTNLPNAAYEPTLVHWRAALETLKRLIETGDAQAA